MADKNYRLNFEMSDGSTQSVQFAVPQGAELPAVTEADNGKTLGVVNGKWGAIPFPISSDGEAYNGPYEVTPAVEAQTLETAQKVMSENVKINAIPYYEVTNNANGKTVTIGSEV